MPLVLVVDDDAPNRITVERILQREGLEVHQAGHARDALDVVRAGRVDVVVTDLKMPGMSGIDLLKAARHVDPDVEVVVMTAYGTVEAAVEAMKEGASDFVTKPLRRHELVHTVRIALEKRGLRIENRALRERLGEPAEESAWIGNSALSRQLLAEVEQVAPSEATVLLTGDSGTGKGHLARLLHRASRRRDGRFVTVNCAAIPEALLESELFGYERGAFTGASAHKDGRFDLARGGTLFLDEIAETTPALQVRLLRVLQDGEYERVGGTETIRADVRVVAATNRDIEAEVTGGRFREDLYYRLNVIRIGVPPLRERPEDIPLLAWHFLHRYGTKNGKEFRGLSPEAVEALLAWRWPGNVRELENAMERAAVLCREDLVGECDLPPPMRAGRAAARKTLEFEVGTPLKVVERRLIEETLRATGGDKSLAANLLGITARTIYRREAEWSGRVEADGDDGA
jgi:two-component system response regulator HydG